MLNTYLVAGFLACKQIRQLQFYPIFLQALCDLLTCGLGGILFYMSELHMKVSWKADYYYEFSVSLRKNFIVRLPASKRVFHSIKFFKILASEAQHFILFLQKPANRKPPSSVLGGVQHVFSWNLLWLFCSVFELMMSSRNNI